VIRIVATGDVSDVERKKLDSGKSIVNFRLAAEGLSLRCAAWEALGESVPDSGRVLIEGRMFGRDYMTRDNPPVKRTSTEVTISSIERLDAATPDEADETLPF
jgi:single-stranded DNA-binding protein